MSKSQEINLEYEALLATPLGERFLSEFRMLARDHWVIDENNEISTETTIPTAHIWIMAKDLVEELHVQLLPSMQLVDGLKFSTSVEAVDLMWYARNTRVEPEFRAGKLCREI